MDHEDDILQKADALLRKRRAAPSTDFPVLTQVVDPLMATDEVPDPMELHTNHHHSQGEIPHLNVDALRIRVLERALVQSNVDISEWLDASIREELRSLTQKSVEKLAEDAAGIAIKEESALVLKSIQNALELELLDIRSGPNSEKLT